jgi:hypothetical protein
MQILISPFSPLSFSPLYFLDSIIFLKGSAVLCTLLQRRVLKLDEMGDKAKSVRDLASDADRKGKRYEKVIVDYIKRLFVIKNGGLL